MPEATLKQKVLDSIEKLPQDASLDDIIERIYFIHKIEIDLKQSQQGDVVDHEEVLKRIEKMVKLHWTSQAIEDLEAIFVHQS